MTQRELISEQYRNQNRLAADAPVTNEQLATLTTLYAWDNGGISDAGLAHVPGLTTLYAGGNSGITDAALKKFNQ